jgi:hypothetical protein
MNDDTGRRWPGGETALGGLLVLLGLGLATPGRVGEVLAGVGGVVTMAGLVLLVQNATDQFDTWAYAWSLVFLVGAGLGRWLTGAVRGRHDLATSGRGLISIGLVAFVGLAVLFELVVGIGEEGRPAGAAGRYAVAVVLILAGLVLLGRRLLGTRQP